jgi:hypothetical protein
LFGAPALGRSNGEDNANGGGFDDQCECFTEINADALGEPTHHPTGFVAPLGPIGIELVLEDPFDRDYVSAGRTIDKAPCAIILQRLKLQCHGRMPI